MSKPTMVMVEADFFPTLAMRETMAETDAEILGLLRREANKDPLKKGFVIADLEDLALRYHRWPETGCDKERSREFVKERVQVFVRLGLIARASRTAGGKRILGFVIQARREPEKEFTAADRKFLKSVGVASLP